MFLIYIIWISFCCFVVLLNHEGNQLVHFFFFCHKYRVKPIVNGKMKINIPAGGENERKTVSFVFLKSLWGVVSNSTNSRSALVPNVRLRLYWVTVGDTQGEQRFITVIMLNKQNKNKTIGMCFLVDMADCVCEDDVQTYSIYIYKTCWYTSLSTFTLPFPETIKPLTKKQKLFTLLNEDVWKHHMTWATHRPTHKSSFIQNCDARGSNSTQCYILEGGGRVRQYFVHQYLQSGFPPFLWNVLTLVAVFLYTEVMDQTLRVSL